MNNKTKRVSFPEKFVPELENMNSVLRRLSHKKNPPREVYLYEDGTIEIPTSREIEYYHAISGMCILEVVQNILPQCDHLIERGECVETLYKCVERLQDVAAFTDVFRVLQRITNSREKEKTDE